MAFDDDVYFELRRCTTPDSIFADTIAVVPKSGGNLLYLPIAAEVAGASTVVVDARRGVSWVGWVEEPRHETRNYPTSLDGRTVTKIMNPLEIYDSEAPIFMTDDVYTYSWYLGEIIRWPEP
jgi:hypothetical protein